MNKIQPVLDQVEALKNALSAGQLSHGSALEVEQLDLAGIGMYSQEQKDKFLLEGVLEDDFFLKTLLDTTMWARKSDEGIKWHIYNVKNIKFNKDIK